MNEVTFWKNVKYFRTLRGLTLEEMGNKLGYTKAGYRRLELSNTTKISEDMLQKFALILETDIQSLLLSKEEPMGKYTSEVKNFIESADGLELINKLYLDYMATKMKRA